MSVLVICVGVAAFGLGKGSALVTESDESTGYIDRSPEMSSKTRHSASTTEYAGTYMASEQGTKYHLPWCPSAQQIHEENRVWFDSRADAVAAGYTPAANCEGL